MSNVGYACPKPGCRNTFFGPPGGTNVKCPRHTEDKFEQVEEYQGPNFAFKDEGEVAPHKTGIIATGQEQNVTPVVKKVTAPEMSDDELKQYYRDQYRRVTGQEVDFRWGVNRLKEEIEAWENASTPEPTPAEDPDANPDEEVVNDGETFTVEDPDAAPGLDTPLPEDLQDSASTEGE